MTGEALNQSGERPVLRFRTDEERAADHEQLKITAVANLEIEFGRPLTTEERKKLDDIIDEMAIRGREAGEAMIAYEMAQGIR
jgi:hypothetical protein